MEQMAANQSLTAIMGRLQARGLNVDVENGDYNKCRFVHGETKAALSGRMLYSDALHVALGLEIACNNRTLMPEVGI